jgi:hypothetical protein
MQLMELSEATAARRRAFFQAVDVTNGITPITGLSGTGFISKNGAGGATSASITQIDATNLPGRYYVEFAQASLDTLGILAFRYKNAACAEVVVMVQIVPWDPYSATNMGLTNLDVVVSTRATPAQVNTEVLDVMNVDTFAQPGQGTPLATTTIFAMIRYLYKNWRNRKVVTKATGVIALYNDDETTVDQKSTATDDDVTFNQTEIITGP